MTKNNRFETLKMLHETHHANLFVSHRVSIPTTLYLGTLRLTRDICFDKLYNNTALHNAVGTGKIEMIGYILDKCPQYVNEEMVSPLVYHTSTSAYK